MVEKYEKSLSLSLSKVDENTYEVGKLLQTSLIVTLEQDYDCEPMTFSQETEFSSTNLRVKGRFKC